MDKSFFLISAAAISINKRSSIISNNISNASTTGFKRSEISFKSLLRQANNEKSIEYPVVGTLKPDMQAGAIRPTGNPLDVAILDNGYFKIELGSKKYLTRDGHFSVGSNGYLRGVGGSFVLDESSSRIEIDPSKKVIINASAQILTGGKPSVSIGIYDIVDGSPKSVSGSLFEVKNSELISKSNIIIPMSLENSNVNAVLEMSSMVEVNRGYQTMMKVLGIFDSGASLINQKIGGLR